MVNTSLQWKQLWCTPRYIGIKVYIFKRNILPSSWQQCWAELSWVPWGKVWSVVMVLICLTCSWPSILCALMLSYSVGTWLRLYFCVLTIFTPVWSATFPVPWIVLFTLVVTLINYLVRIISLKEQFIFASTWWLVFHHGREVMGAWVSGVWVTWYQGSRCR